jgi:hypothetical protein
MAAKSGIVGSIYKESSTTATFTAEESTLSADNKSVVIDDDTLTGFVRDASLFTVYYDEVEVTEPYEIHFDRIIFLEERAEAGDLWTISGTYAELEKIGGAYEWNIDIKHNVQDKTEFGDTWEQKLPGILGWSASAKRHYIEADWIDFVEDGLPIIIRLFTDIDTYDSFVGYGQIDGIKAGNKVDGITDAEISFSGDGSVIWCDKDLVEIA